MHDIVTMCRHFFIQTARFFTSHDKGYGDMCRGLPRSPGLGSSPRGPVTETVPRRARAGQTSALCACGAIVRSVSGARCSAAIVHFVVGVCFRRPFWSNPYRVRLRGSFSIQPLPPLFPPPHPRALSEVKVKNLPLSPPHLLSLLFLLASTV